jgi:hypothetical protein
MENNMTNNPKKLLLTVLAALSLIIGQAALFGGTPATHAGSAFLIFAPGSGTATTNAQGTATTIDLQGSGFVAGSTVVVEFNDAVLNNGTVATPVAGDPNAVFPAAAVTADASGNIGAGGKYVTLTIPATAPAGTYAIVASDGAGDISAPLYYTITSPGLTVTSTGGYTATLPTGYNGASAPFAVPLGGELIVQSTGLSASAATTFTLANIATGAAIGGPLTIVTCNGVAAPAGTTTCAASLSGTVLATVAVPGGAIAGLKPGQTVAVDASNGTTVFSGIHIDNTLATLTASTTAAAAGSTVTLNGSGFASSTAVTITQSVNGAAGTPVTSAVTTDANGRFTYSYTIPTSGATVGLTATDTAGNATASTTNIFISTVGVPAAGGLHLTPSTASVGQTVTFSATGFVAGDTVEVLISSNATGATCLTPTALTYVTVVSGGLVNGSFTVPTGTCVAGTSTSFAGATANVTLTDLNNSASTSANLTVGAPTVNLTAQPGTLSNTLVLSATGFAANEPVSVTYNGNIIAGCSLLAGTTNSQVFVTDATGSIPNTQISDAYGNCSGVYTVKASGLNSGFTATAAPNIALNGYLSAPSTVVPGQVFTVSGSDFAPGTGTLSVNFASPPQTAAVTIGGTGTFTQTYTVPSTTPTGPYLIQVSAPVPGTTASQTRTLPITVVALSTSSITLASATGLVGGTVGINATGYAPNEPIAVSVQYGATSGLSGTDVPGTKQIFTADSTGALSATYTVQSSVAGTLVPGSYNIAVVGQNSGIKNVQPFTVSGVINTNAPATNIYFAEGYTGQTSGGASANFNETLSILNSNNFTTTYTVSYFKEGSTTPISVTGTIGAFSVVQRSVNTDVGNGASVAAEVSAPAPIAAERIIGRTTASGANLGASTSLGQTLNLSATAPASGFDYYFASGAVQLTNEEYLTILNPNSTAASVTINILPQTAISATTSVNIAPIKETVNANSRLTVPLRKTLLGLGAGAGFQFGMDVNSTLPIAVENVMYQGDGSGSGKYGSTTTPAGSGSFRQYLFASDFGVAPSTGLNAGAIGTGNDVSEVDIINPGAAANGSATVTVSFFGKSGSPINSQQIQVDGGTRETVSVNDIAGVNPDVFSVVVTSDKNIYVELPIAFGGNPANGGTYATEDIAGTVPGLTSAAFPYLDATAGTTAVSQTVFLYNPGASSITVNAVYSAGTKSVTKTYTIGANSITQVNVATDAVGLGVTSGIGGYFAVSSSTPGSLVAFAQANTSDYKWAIGTQGTYASSFSSGS